MHPQRMTARRVSSGPSENLRAVQARPFLSHGLAVIPVTCRVRRRRPDPAEVRRRRMRHDSCRSDGTERHAANHGAVIRPADPGANSCGVNVRSTDHSGATDGGGADSAATNSGATHGGAGSATSNGGATNGGDIHQQILLGRAHVGHLRPRRAKFGLQRRDGCQNSRQQNYAIFHSQLPSDFWLVPKPLSLCRKRPRASPDCSSGLVLP